MILEKFEKAYCISLWINAAFREQISQKIVSQRVIKTWCYELILNDLNTNIAYLLSGQRILAFFSWHKIQTGRDIPPETECQISTPQGWGSGESGPEIDSNKIQTFWYKIQTVQDKIQTGQDKIQTVRDIPPVTECQISTPQGSESGESGPEIDSNKIQTGRDKIQTGQDKIQTVRDIPPVTECQISTPQGSESGESGPEINSEIKYKHSEIKYKHAKMKYKQMEMKYKQAEIYHQGQGDRYQHHRVGDQVNLGLKLMMR